ncbi:NAD(P)-binding domain-containing protein [Actinomycetospora cinnamomea]|uniref:NAD(P)-binding domain-containing protein n=1 Tax=Actinomycetospora cinnamomea TaxID=663609 RepID=UPI001A9CA7FC
MGTALARALLRAGHAVTVWNRSPACADVLVRESARHAADPAAALAASPLTIVCLLDDAAVGAVLDPLGGGGRRRTMNPRALSLDRHLLQLAPRCASFGRSRRRRRSRRRPPSSDAPPLSDCLISSLSRSRSSGFVSPARSPSRPWTWTR